MSDKLHLAVTSAIKNLRTCNILQSEVIEHLEGYRRTVEGLDSGSLPPRGFGEGYSAELGYLESRRAVLDALIASVERYQQGSEVALRLR